MPKHIKTSFNAGKLSASLDGRVDIAKYYNGCSQIVNAIPLSHGGCSKRPGTEFVAKAKGQCRLIPFEFSASDTMVLEFSNLAIRFYKDGDRVMTDSVNIAAITLTSGAAVSVQTSASHGYATGDIVRFSYVTGTTELNYKGLGTEFTITVVDADEFTLDGTDGDNFTAYVSGGTVASIYTLASPYATADLFKIQYVQSADVIYLTHEDYPPKKLTRISDNSWTIADFDLVGGPFLLENTDAANKLKITGSTHTGANNAATLTDSTQAWTVDSLIGYTVYNITDSSSGTITDNDATTITATLANGTDNKWDTGDVYVVIKDGYYIPAGMKNLTLTATRHTPLLGTADDVGSRWLLKHARADNTDRITKASSGTATSDKIKIKGDFSVDCSGFSDAGDRVVLSRRKGSSGDWQEVRTFTAASAYSSTEVEDDIYYKIAITKDTGTAQVIATLTAKEQFSESIVKVTAHSSTTVCTVTAETDIYYVGGEDTAGNITYLWAEGAFSIRRGYPRAIAMHENRLWFAGTTYNPQTIWGSKSSDFDNFTAGSLDDDSVQITIEDSDVSQIQWMASDEALLVGTAKKEYKLSASNIDDPITPSDVRARFQSSHGSYHIQPVQLNNSTFYFQGLGQRLRLMRFVDTSLRYESDDATLLANDIFESTPVQIGAQRIPDATLWVVREDGVLCSFSYEPKEDVVGWSEHVTGGLLYTPVGKFTSVAVIRGAVEDDIYVTVMRHISGSDVYYVEKFHPRQYEQTDTALMMDSAVIFESDYSSTNIVYASGTVTYGVGTCGTGRYGGTYG